MKSGKTCAINAAFGMRDNGRLIVPVLVDCVAVPSGSVTIIPFDIGVILVKKRISWRVRKVPDALVSGLTEKEGCEDGVDSNFGLFTLQEGKTSEVELTPTHQSRPPIRLVSVACSL